MLQRSHARASARVMGASMMLMMIMQTCTSQTNHVASLLARTAVSACHPASPHTHTGAAGVQHQTTSLTAYCIP
eukprot:118565-Chlamydomonas_euryale.AAC.2